MLSDGDYYKRVPTDPELNLRLRRLLVSRAQTDARLRRGLVEACRRDIIFFVNVFGWQHNPQKVGDEVGPFVCWPFQVDLIRYILSHIETRKDGLVEKSREMGATWCNLFADDWLCRFHGNKKFLTISHTEAAVDKKGDIDSLFEKMRFINRHLPGWMPRMHSKKLVIEYPGARSANTGAATTERAGVGGRATAITLEEFAKQKDAAKILSDTADTGIRIVISTHYGVGTEFFKLATAPGADKCVLHWSQHPQKRPGLYRSDPGLRPEQRPLDPGYKYPADFEYITDGTPTGGPHPGVRSPWYDAECRRRKDRRDVAMHLDIDAKGSGDQFFDPMLIAELTRDHCRDPNWSGDLLCDPTGRSPARLVPTPGGPLRLWVNPDFRGSVPPSRYTIGGDISQGIGSTPSCLSIFDALAGEKVGQFTSAAIRPDKLAPIAAGLGLLFADAEGDPAVACWEDNGPGALFRTTLLESGYRNVWYAKANPGALHQRDSDRPGWHSTEEGKLRLLQDYHSALRDRRFTNRDKGALAECLEFVYTAQGVSHGQELDVRTPSRGRKNHGDHVIADALAWLAAQPWVRPLVEPDKAPAPAVAPVGSLAWRRELDRREREELTAW